MGQSLLIRVEDGLVNNTPFSIAGPPLFTDFDCTVPASPFTDVMGPFLCVFLQIS